MLKTSLHTPCRICKMLIIILLSTVLNKIFYNAFTYSPRNKQTKMLNLSKVCIYDPRLFLCFVNISPLFVLSS